MKLAKIHNDRGDIQVAIIDDGFVIPLDMKRNPKVATLADILYSPDPEKLAKSLILTGVTHSQVNSARFLAPIDRQEVWASGVTYKRSKVAREEESEGAAQFYDKVYSALRPELFFKATPERTAAHGEPIRVRADSKWNVPEPELTLVISPDLRIVGYTIGNDVSSRDIEGENPLYLPQAKVYHGSCSIGPVITLANAIPDPSKCEIRLIIHRNKQVAFDGSTSFSQMNRTPKELVEWLGKENRFPHGVMLMTGTGIVPPDSFSLGIGDVVDISISGIGTLTNPVGP
jgi:2-dehydro-3-deoxy-D-arabinonate dehydratase